MNVDGAAAATTSHVYCGECIVDAIIKKLEDPFAAACANGAVPCSMNPTGQSPTCFIDSACMARIIVSNPLAGQEFIARMRQTADRKVQNARAQNVLGASPVASSAAASAAAAPASNPLDPIVAAIKLHSGSVACPQCDAHFGDYIGCASILCTIMADDKNNIVSGCGVYFCGVCKYFISADDHVLASGKTASTVIHEHISTCHSYGLSVISEANKKTAFRLLCEHQAVEAILRQPESTRIALLRAIESHCANPDEIEYPMLKGIRLDHGAITLAVIRAAEPWKRGQPVPTCKDLFKQPFNAAQLAVDLDEQERNAQQPAHHGMDDDEAENDPAGAQGFWEDEHDIRRITGYAQEAIIIGQRIATIRDAITEAAANGHMHPVEDAADRRQREDIYARVLDVNADVHALVAYDYDEALRDTALRPFRHSVMELRDMWGDMSLIYHEHRHTIRELWVSDASDRAFSFIQSLLSAAKGVTLALQRVCETTVTAPFTRALEQRTTMELDEQENIVAAALVAADVDALRAAAARAAPAATGARAAPAAARAAPAAARAAPAAAAARAVPAAARAVPAAARGAPAGGAAAGGAAAAAAAAPAAAHAHIINLTDDEDDQPAPPFVAPVMQAHPPA
jgi:hypothetical protein